MLGLTPASDYSESSTCSTDAGKVCGSGQNAGRSGDGTSDLLGMGLPICWGWDCRSGDGTADLGTGLPIWGRDCRSGDVASVNRHEHDQKFYWNHDILAKGIDD